MRVARVVLQNVKSYADSTTIELAPGINAVCGENGAGKSTILEAIGFTLFGYRPYKLDAFLREGEKSGSIVVTVEDDDGCSYQLERKLGSSASQAVYDETGTRIAEGEADVRAWRLGFFGMEPGSDLAKLFEDTVGPPQGTLTSVFLEGTADKKDKFDRLLGIKDYPRAAEELRALSNHFRGLAEEASRRAANLEGRVARLPALEERHGERVGRRSELGARLDALARRQEALVTARDRLEGALRSVQAAASTLEVAEARARDAQRREGELVAELRRAEEAARVVEASRPGAQAYGEAEALLKTLEARRRERDRLQEEVRSAERNAFQWAQQAKTWEEKLAALAADEARAAELASLAPEQERRERAVADAQERVRARRDAEALRPAILQRRSASLERRREAEAQLARVEAARPQAEKLGGLRNEQRSLREQVVALEKSAWALKQAETDLARERDRLARLAAEAEALGVRVDTLRPLEALASQVSDRQREWDAAFGETRGLESRLQEAQRSRKQVEGGLCPFLHEPCNNLRPGVSLDAHFDGVIAEAGASLGKLRSTLPALSAQLESCRSAQRDSAKLPDLLLRLAGTTADRDATVV
ncbi:MAG TPA: SMC family ATPase, partial [Chloroflexota bacterium]|nr:SMC family ATPase [Chloroflexota bacterium]